MGESQPLISVITPVGPRHRDHVAVAHASLRWQTVPRSWWEHIVVHDTGRRGPAACRNAGLDRARGRFVVFLDADDYLIPTALETYLRAYVASDAGYIYADNYVIDPDGVSHYSASGEYIQERMAVANIHVVTALVPAAHARAVGGFDENVDAWEDWTLWLRLAIAGHCGQRVPLPCLVYRTGEGDRMRRFLADPQENLGRMRLVQQRYETEGRIAMGCCAGRGTAGDEGAEAAARAALLGLPVAEQLAPPSGGAIRMQYVGPQLGSFQIRSPITGQTYKGGRGRLVDVAEKHAGYDVPWLESMEGWRRVAAVPPFIAPPDPGAVADVTPGTPDLALVLGPVDAPAEQAAEDAATPEREAEDARDEARDLGRAMRAINKRGRS